MAVFTKKKFRSPADTNNSIASKYRGLINRYPFAFFGLPFIATMVAGSFFLTPATALRFERHDRKIRRMSNEEALGLGKSGRRVDMKEEYYRLAAKDLDDWEQKRVKRLPGEHDGVL